MYKALLIAVAAVATLGSSCAFAQDEDAPLPPLIPDVATALAKVADTSPDSERPVLCAALTAMLLDAVDTKQDPAGEPWTGPTGDKAVLTAAYDSWKGALVQEQQAQMDADAAASGEPSDPSYTAQNAADQAFASSYAVYDDTPQDAIKAGADACVAAAPHVG
ncbi:hypothetical protein BH10PSE2_BH10PSE2_06270 [soil metagenome]